MPEGKISLYLYRGLTGVWIKPGRILIDLLINNNIIIACRALLRANCMHITANKEIFDD